MSRNDKTLVNLFLMDNKNKDIYQLNESFMYYYYNLSPRIQNSIDISYLWGLVLNEWAKNN